MVKNERIRYASHRIASKRNGRVFWSDGRGHGRLQLRTGQRSVADRGFRAARTFRNQLKFRPQRRIFTMLHQHPVGIVTDDGENVVQLVRHVAADLLLGIRWQLFVVLMSQNRWLKHRCHFHINIAE